MNQMIGLFVRISHYLRYNISILCCDLSVHSHSVNTRNVDKLVDILLYWQGLYTAAINLFFYSIYVFRISLS